MPIGEQRHKIILIIKDYLNGDDDAFRLLYEETSADLTRYCYSAFSGLTPNQVDDIIQISYIKISRNIKSLNELDSFLPWAFQIVRTTGIDYLKKERKYVYISQDNEQVNWLESIPDDSQDSFPDEKVYAEDVKDVVVSALKCLNREIRETFCLFYFDHLKINEIADIQGIKTGTVKSRLFAAREKLREKLSKLIYPEKED